MRKTPEEMRKIFDKFGMDDDNDFELLTFDEMMEYRYLVYGKTKEDLINRINKLNEEIEDDLNSNKDFSYE